MSNELLACPFCGHDKPYLRHDNDSAVATGGYNWIAVCGECGASSDYYESDLICTNYWNTRTHPQPVTPAGGEVEPVAWSFQHDETGRMTVSMNGGINTPDAFLRLNPRFHLVGPLYTHPPVADAALVREVDVDQLAPCDRVAIYEQVEEVADGNCLRVVAKRNLRSLIEIGSNDKKLMLSCLEELS